MRGGRAQRNRRHERRVPQLDVGPNTDVLDGCAKEAGLRWMLRAMSPQALVTDELGGAMDAQAVLDAARSGVSVLATLHGRDLQAACRGESSTIWHRTASLIAMRCWMKMRWAACAPCATSSFVRWRRPHDGRGGRAVLPAGGYGGGSWLRDRRLRRLRTLRARLDVVASLRLMLEQERMGLTELLCQCAHYAPTGPGGEQVSRRLLWVAHALVQEPLLSLGDAYAQACAQIPIPWEKAEEREAMRALFLQLGSGTAAMRAQAAAACLRRLRPLEEDARREAEKGGGLVMRLGLLLGLMAGIALW